ncbi:MAG: hypothetical protein IJI46_08135 [Erysipelotrichaceae bacterium]|nr:hypothetical protein [Erysipelotrichaceae bacterium]
MNKTLRIILCLFMILSFSACSASQASSNNSETPSTPKQDNIVYPQADVEELSSFYVSDKQERDWGTLVNMYGNETAYEAYSRYRDFSNRLLINSIERGKNEFISPLSLYYALAILTNGASGNTRRQLENTLGMNTEDLNNFLHDMELFYKNYDDSSYFIKANALWFNTHHGLSLNKDFLATINEYYGDCVAENDFGDGSGLAKSVNDWASENTNGAIGDLVSDNDFTELTSFIILNALATGDKWSFPFDSADTYYQEFTSYNGEKKLVEMMHQTVWGHWSDSLSQGFARSLYNGVMVSAILPNEGVDVYDYLNQMKQDTFIPYAVMDTGYSDIENTADGYDCIADIHYTNLSFPKFSFEREYDISEVLKKMGLSDIFDFSTSDFSAMADGDPQLVDKLLVDQVKQKTELVVNEEEVVASAVTVVLGGLGAAGCDERQTIYHDVVFDRPFIIVLSIGSDECLLPLFVGVVNDLGETVSNAIRIENITGKINIRSIPSTSGEKLGTYQKGEIVYAFETKEAEGYTWYRIGENKWVADQKGEWIKVLD